MKNKLSLFAVPYVGWMSIFVVAPIIIMVVYAFSTAAGDFTLENFARMGTYTAVFTRSFKLAIIATLIALLIGYPVSYMLSKEGPQVQRIAMVLIMLPMWMNFLLRTYSWMSILENNGLLNQLFQQIGLIDLYNQIAMHFASDPAAYVPIDHFQMIGTQGAVVLGMVYNYLPFMILPIYTVLLKMDPSLKRPGTWAPAACRCSARSSCPCLCRGCSPASPWCSCPPCPPSPSPVCWAAAPR